MKRMCSGSITIFCSIVFPFVVLLLMCILGYGRHQTIKNSVRTDLDTAGFSTMAEYDKNWVREYGLYIIPKSRIEEGMYYYMEENRIHSYGNYQIEELAVTVTGNLLQITELQEQILMFMKERGLVEFVEDVAATLLQMKELDQQINEEVNWKESDELLRVQQLYAELVTVFEGIRNDGNKNLYSINHVLEKDPSILEVLEVLKLEKLNSEQLGVLERAYDELDQVAYLCEEAQAIGRDLENAIEEVEKKEEIPITGRQLREHRTILKENRLLCETASKAIQDWISLLTEEDRPEEIRERAIQAVEELEKYDRSIQLEYEYKESDKTWNFSAILSSLKGYPFDVEEIAPDKELDLECKDELAESETESELDLENITISDSFGDQFLVTEYVLGMFQNFEEAASLEKGGESLNLRGEEKKNRFFNNEVEYLLIGKANEYKNVNGTKNYIVALRSVMNMVHLLSDGEKRAEIEALAGAIGGILLPGIGNGIFFGIILAIWSWGEAIVDYQVLVEGGEVPLLKTRDSWRTTLSAILSLDIPDAQEDPGKGMNYKQYLRLLLYTVNQEKLISRIQNLLQFNHQNQSLADAVTCFVVEGTASYGNTQISFAGEYDYGAYVQ